MCITRVCVAEGLIHSAAVLTETGCTKRRRCKNGSNLHWSTHIINAEFNSRKPHHDGAQAEQPGHRSQQDAKIKTTAHIHGSLFIACSPLLNL